jgi:hypothetical protein
VVSPGAGWVGAGWLAKEVRCHLVEVDYEGVGGGWGEVEERAPGGPGEGCWKEELEEGVRYVIEAEEEEGAPEEGYHCFAWSKERDGLVGEAR